MSNDGDREEPSTYLHMDGMTLLVNMLMGALRRSAAVSLGAKMDSRGYVTHTEDCPAPSAQDLKELMERLAAQGLKDVLLHGMMGIDEMKNFTACVAARMAEEHIAKRDRH